MVEQQDSHETAGCRKGPRRRSDPKPLCPVWLTLVLSAGAGLLLAAVFPGHHVKAKSIAAYSPSALSLAYLQAGLSAEPTSLDHLDTLADHSLKLARWQEGLSFAERMERLSSDATSLQRALAMELVAAEQLLYGLDATDPDWPQQIGRFENLLNAARHYTWTVPEMRSLASKALDAGLSAIAAEFYSELVLTDSTNAAWWEAKRAQVQHSTQEYEAAADAYFAAYRLAETTLEKRAYFIAALQVLESGDKIEQASRQGHEHIGLLIDDRLTVRYVLSLAVRAAHTELIQHYARILRELSADIEQAGAQLSAVTPYLMTVSAPASPAVAGDGSSLPVTELQEEYELLFTAFVESGALDDAVEVAREALERQLDPLIWHPRLAQVSQWNSDPESALKHWVQYALQSNDPEAWDAVLNLSPQLDEDDTFLLAWKARHGAQPVSQEDVRSGLMALMARYVATAHWESVVRVLNRLQETDASLQKPELLLLRITATEQRAYQFAPEDPQREALMSQVRALLSDSAALDQWANEELAWLAERARATGAHRETAHYFRLLASRDPDQAPQWFRKLGDAQLASQDYEAAADAYFSARSAATSVEEQREYYQAAVNAFVSGNKVDRAMDAATEQLGDLADDAATLRYLVNVARLSGRPELVTKYARKLLEVGRKKPDISYGNGMRPGEADLAATGHGHQMLWRGDVPVRSLVSFGSRGHHMDRILVANAASASSTEPDDYEIAFRAFLESQALDDAERTAELALASGRPAALWAPRLAQVAQWNNHPDKAMTYWKIAAQETGDKAAWQAALQLARQRDNVAVQIEALVGLVKQSHGELGHVIELAELQHHIGHTDVAVQTLRMVRNRVGDGPESARFWRLYGHLAHDQKERSDADFAYRRLLASGHSDPNDLQSMAVFYERHPLDSGRLAEVEFRQTGSLYAWQRAMQAYSSVGAKAHIESLLGAVSAEQQAIERSPDALIARAQYRLREGERDAGLKDMRSALRLDAATDQTRLAYLWALVDYGTERELREALIRAEPLAFANPDFLAAVAAGWLRVGESVRAVQYFRRQRLSRGDDPLWLIALASAEESAGNPARARLIRDQAWQLLPPLPMHTENIAGTAANQAAPHQITTNEAAVARALLAADRVNADHARAVLIRLLHDDAQRVAQDRRELSVLGNIPGLPPLAITSGDVNGAPSPTFSSEARQTALAWAIATEAYPLADAWLARHYAHDGAPADARLAVAMGVEDRAQTESVLKEPTASLPIDGRIQGLVRTRDIAQAQTLAYQAAEGAPYNEGRYEVLAGVTRMTGERPSVGADVVFSDTEPLRYTETTLNGFIKLTQRQGVGVQVTDRDQRSTNSDVLAWVPSHDREATVAFSDHTPYRTIVAKAGYRDAWETFLTASLRAEFRPDDKIKIGVDLGLNQFTNISQLLQVAAVKDRILLFAQWSPDRHWFVDGAVELARFRTQDRTSLGDSAHLVAMAGYRFGGELDGWSLRAFTARGNYSAKDRTVDAFQRLVPGGHSLQAEAFMPQDFTQYGAFITYGSNDKSPYSRRWRPFLEAGYIRDSNQGWGPTVHAGAGGPVWGKDQLRFFYFYSATPQGGGQRVRQVGLSYRFFF